MRLIDADMAYRAIKDWLVKFFTAYEKDGKDERIAALLELDLAIRTAINDTPTIADVRPVVCDDMHDNSPCLRCRHLNEEDYEGAYSEQWCEEDMDSFGSAEGCWQYERKED